MTSTSPAVRDIYRLTPLQRGMLFQTLLQSEAGDYTTQLALRLRGPLDPEAFRSAWRFLVARHAALRTAFVWEGVQEPVQVVIEEAEPSFLSEDWSALAPAEREPRLAALLESDRATPFDLRRPPLMRVRLARLEPQLWQLVWSSHHLLFDGWSLPILWEELWRAYEAARAGSLEHHADELPPAPPWRDYVAWLADRDREAARGFWREALAGLDEPAALPFLRPAPEAGLPGSTETPQSPGAARVWRDVERTLTPAASQALERGARAAGATLSTLVSAAWALVVGRLSGTREVVLGTVRSGRPPELADVEAMVGMFVNTVPARFTLDEDVEVAHWLARAQRASVALREHEWFPLSEVHEALDRSSAAPLFESLVVFENYPLVPRGEGGGEAADESRARATEGVTLEDVRDLERSNVPLNVIVTPGAALHLRLGFDARRVPEALAPELLESLAQALAELAGGAVTPGRRLGALGALSPAQAQRLARWGDGGPALRPARSVRALFAEQVERQPGAIACEDERERLDFATLDARARALSVVLATRLANAASDVGPACGARPVAVALAPSCELLVALLAAARLGRPWLLVDPELPPERLRTLLAEAAPALVVGDERLGRLAAPGTPCVAARGPWTDDERATRAAETPEPGPEDLAYVVLTSGSTGRPKAVEVPQRAIASLVAATARAAGLAGGRRVAQLTATSFDVATLEILAGLLSGATVCFVPPNERVPGAPLTAALARLAVDTLFLSPAVLRELDPRALPALGTLFVGGESLTAELAARWSDRRLIHAYGPAEATVTATQHELASADAIAAGDAPPIGRPLPGVQAWVVDDALRPVPPGGIGELVLGGLGVARGYRGLPRESARRFVPDPFGVEAGARLYRTGDRVRWKPDGRDGASLCFVGRDDDQVKVRGVRVELAEVEAAALAHPDVQQAGCACVAGGSGGELVLWFAPRSGARLEPAQLRRFLAQRLPLALVPGRIEARAALPLSAGGKLDRAALAASLPALDARAFEPPRTALERALAAGFAAVLGRAEVGRDDDFFALGGQSLRALQLVSRLRETLGSELTLRTLYEHPSVAALARAIEGGDDSADATPTATAAEALPPLVPRRRSTSDAEERLPASLAQRRLWFLERFQPGSARYVVPVGLRLRGALDVAALEHALDALVARHEVLRTSFGAEGAEPFQRPEPHVPLALERVSPQPGEDLGALLGRLARRPFDLERAPLVRATLVRVPATTEPGPDDRAQAEDHALLLAFHHVAADGWSLGILVDELARLYAARRAGTPADLPPLPLQYADFALWQASPAVAARRERDVAHWVAALSPPPAPLELPERKLRPPQETHAGHTAGLSLSPALRGRVEALARELGTTPFAVVFAAFAAWLGKLTGRRDFLVGTPVAGRERRELEGLIGLFVNTLPLRAELAGDPSFRTLVARAHERVLELHAHAQAPFERLVEELVPERDLARPPLVQVLFAFQNLSLELPRLEGVAVEPLELDTETAKFDLSAFVDEPPADPARAHDPEGNGHAPAAGWRLTLEGNTALFTPETIALWLRSFAHVLERLAADPSLRPSQLTLADADEERLLLGWGRASATHPRQATIPSRFARAVRAWPDAPAVVFDGKSLTYAELDRAANRLAWHLLALGLAPEERVAIALERSLELVVAIVAVLKAGGAYVPLDPLYPAERRRRMLADARARVLLTQRSLVEEHTGEDQQLALCLDDPAVAAELAAEPEHDPGVRLRPDQLAYLMYTSGSTGTPKGVGVEHRAIVRLLCGEPFLELGPDEVVLQFVSSAFDVAVWEQWAALFHGARLELYRPQKPSLAELGAFVRERGVTTMWLTTGLFHQMVDERPQDLAGVRQLMAGGEALSPTHVRRALDRLPRTRLVNGYGPTEASCFTTTHAFAPDDDLEDVLAVPIGRPTGGLRVYVLDDALRLLPRGAWGELWAAGDGLARGYLNDARLTAERFVPDPFATEPGARMYRIGDRARWLSDGTLEYGGRVDRQVKVRGFRLELGEVEAALDAHPAVKKSVVELRGAGEAKHLVAWVVPVGAPAGGPTPEELRAFLRTRLPEPMLPARFARLAELPLTPNGKLDRRALPEPGQAAGDGRARAPEGALEELLAAIWRDVLALERAPARDDDFFALGGHSLLATQLVVRVREAFGVELSLQTVFRHPRLAELAEAIARARRAPGEGEADDAAPACAAPASAPPEAAPGPRHEPERGDAPLSFAQERLWFLERFQPGGGGGHTPFGVDLQGPLAPADVARLERALQVVMERHAALRTSFPEVDGRPVQRVAPPTAAAAFALERFDLSTEPDSERREQALAALQRRVVHDAFDLERGPLWRAALARLAPEQHVLFLCLHHLVCDGWSMALFARDLAAAHEALVRGEEPERAEPRPTYADFARWQRERIDPARRERWRAAWRPELSGTTERLGLGRSPRRTPGAPRRSDGLSLDLERALTERVEALARELGATPFLLYLAALQAVLGRASGCDDFVIGTPVAGRGRREIEELVGMFVNLLPLRARLADDPPFRTLVARARESALLAHEHQELPVEDLVELLRRERREQVAEQRGSELFDVLFTLHNTPPAALRLAGLETRRRGVVLDGAFATLWLSLEPPALGAGARRSDDVGLHAYFHWDADVLEQHAGEELSRAWRRALEAFCRDPELRPGQLALAGDEEARDARRALRAPARHPRGATIDGLLSQVALERGAATALAWEGGAWSYAELERRANRLARHLRGLGVGPETRVGVTLPRSPELVCALVAVLRAGGAYVPLAPELSEERRAAQLAAAGVSIVLTTEALADELPVGSVWPVALDAEAAAIEAESEAPLEPPPGDGAGRLAYVLFTSGTTGEPKAVGVEHASVVRLVRGAPFVHLGPEEVLLQFAPVAFDASTFEVWGALLNGARLELFPDGPASLEALGRFVRERGVSTLWLTATLFHQMVAERAADLVGVRQLLAGGEALSPQAVGRALEALPDTQLVNGYGPTECTTFVATHAIERGEDLGEGVPLGTPIDDTGLLVLDARMRPVPRGLWGELHVSGRGLARGYLNDPRATAERFVPDPWAEERGESGARLYRTGDRVRVDARGRLVFGGRLDRQLKLRGFRIEPGEVEAALCADPRVEAAVVEARGEGDARRLVAWFVPRSGAPAPFPLAELRQRLARSLPAALVPARFVALETLPRTANGKLDRSALAEPDDDGSRSGSRERQAAVGPELELLTELAADVLGLPAVAAEDDFFELGGHSLLATRLVSRVRDAFGIELPLHVIFEHPRLDALARAVLARRADAPAALAPVQPVPRGGAEAPADHPLSFTQERLWLVERLSPGGATYHVPFALELEGRLDAEALARAFDALRERHEALRTRLVLRGDEPRQVVVAPEALEPTRLAAVDLSPLAPDERERRLEALERSLVREPFDLEQGALVRLALVRTAAERHVLFLVLHHLVCDAWSLSVLAEELAETYRAARAGERPSLAALPFQVADVARWQREVLAGPALERDLAWWREHLEGATEPLALSDRVRRSSDGADRSGERPARLWFARIEPALAAAALQLARAEGASLFLTLLAVYQVLLAERSGRRSFVVGTPVAGRGQSGMEGLIGFFVETLALRAELSGARRASFREHLRGVRARTLEAFARQHVPFARVVEAVGAGRADDQQALVQTFFTLQNAPRAVVALEGLSIRTRALSTGAAHAELTLSLEEDGEGGLAVTWEADAGLFEERELQRLQARFEALLAAFVADPELPARGALSGSTELAPTEPLPGPPPVRPGLWQAFVATCTPDAAPAVHENGQELARAELRDAAEALARRLSSRGVRPGERVGLLVHGARDLAIGALGVLRARAAYVPLDPETPPARVAEILAAAEARVCVARAADAALFEGLAVRRVPPTPEPDAAPAADTASSLPDLSGVSADEAAYVVFTSGSSGVPKGVVAPQRGVERLVVDAAYLPLGPGCRLARAANPGFDALTFELWGALLCGGTLVELGRERVLSAPALRAALAAERVTHLFLTTALFEELVRQDPAAFGDLDTLLFGGERHAPATVRRLFAAGRAPRRLLHVYGPTEATTFASFQELAPEDCGTAACEPLQLPIGDAIDATELWVLDEALRPVPEGAPGELFVGGEGLAWGYLGRPAASAASFVPHPFAPAPGARLYHTGDLVRRDADGRLVFLGRRDAQLKLRGFRVEPGEVEAALLTHPAVRAACADARPGPDGDARLVAWVVADPQALEERALLAHVARRLPRAMVPAALVRLDALPLNANGKVDRRALPEPRWEAARTPPAGTRPRPGDPLLELTCVVVADVLGDGGEVTADAVDAVDVGASFFELGGHSLSATRVVARLSQALGREVPLRALFDAPSLEAFAAGLRRPTGTAPLAAPLAAPPSEEPREGPLSFAQERLWFLERLQPGTALYHVPLALRLRGPLERDVLRAAFAHLVRRHEALRTRLVGEGAAARQVVDPAAGPEALASLLEVHELGDLSPEAAEAALDTALERLAREPFDLAARAPWRASLFALAPDEHVLALVVHHALCDGWSLGVLLRELGALSAALAAGDAAAVEALVRAPLAQPIDHARWQRALLAGEAGRAQLDWWRRTLEGVPERLSLPTDRPRPKVQSLRGATLAFELSPALVRDLHRFAREQAATPFVTLHAALVAVLARWSGMDDLCVGTPLAGRSQAALEGTFGFLVDTLVLRSRVDGRLGFRELVRRSRRGVLDAFEHRDVPFERLVEALQLGRDPGRNPLFQVMLAFQDDLVGALGLPGLAVEPLSLSTATAKFDLTVALAHREQPNDEGPALAGEIEYDAALFDAATVERLARHLTTFLQRALAAPDLPLERIALGDEEEERRVAALSRGPRRALAEPFVPVHERVVRQARRTPAAPAVVDGDGSWSYAELERASAAIARELSTRGLSAEEVVGCCARRSRALVAAALGILRAGGVHLALDADHPPARLAAMLADAGARFALADADGAAALAGSDVQVLSIEALQDVAADTEVDVPERAPNAPTAPVTAQRLAYVVFTSGSTGRPKGVAVPHGGLANLVDWHVEAYGLGPGARTTLLAGTSFDASVWELWPSLVAGAALHVVPEAVRGDPPRLCAWLAEQAVDACFLPTPLAEALLAQPGARTLGLATLLTGGDRLRLRPEPGLPFALVNHYGPSEASVVATAGTVAAREAEPADPLAPVASALPTIGRPIDGVVVRVLEPSLAPAAPGVAGELCVGGAGLARGYAGNPRLTAERFVPDPLAEEPGARLYRSGDRAAWNAAGELVFLGRLDEQVQVRGVRVEPGEVEGVLLALPEVAEAAVVAFVEDEATGGSPRLCAWIVARDGQRLETAELRERLRALLPEALVPAEWVQLASLPKNASGKIDRVRLPRPEHAPQRDGARAWSPPRGATEERLAAIWSAVLGRERIARDAGFFDLGGHSLALLEVQARLARECGRDVPVVELFARPTIAELARWLDATAPAADPTAGADATAATSSEGERVHEMQPEPVRGRGSERGRERRRRRSARKGEDS